MPKVEEIESALYDWAPQELAEDWDNCGLQVGDPSWEVSRVLISLDATQDILKKAIEGDFQLVISHHPLIFNPITSLNLKEYTPRLLAGFLRHEIAVVSMHTNLDSAKGGVNDKLCNLLGLEIVAPMISSPTSQDEGLGRICMLPEPMEAMDFVRHVGRSLGLRAVSWSGDQHTTVSKIAVCSGSGSSLFNKALEHGVDAYVTGEIKHSVALQACYQEGLIVIDAGHFATERPVVQEIKKYLSSISRENGWELDIEIGEEASPITFEFLSKG